MDNECGKSLAIILTAVRDNDVGRYDNYVGGERLSYMMYINDQDNVSRKCKKYFSLLPNPTPLLYGFKHYHAILNLKSKRAWIGHCRLSTPTPGEIALPMFEKIVNIIYYLQHCI